MYITALYYKSQLETIYINLLEPRCIHDSTTDIMTTWTLVGSSTRDHDKIIPGPLPHGLACRLPLERGQTRTQLD